MSDAGICTALRVPAANARSALLADAANVPQSVGESTTDVLVGLKAGCKWADW